MNKRTLPLNVFLVVISIIFLNACSYSGGPTLKKCSDICYGLVAYYPFFSDATDESGNNHHGELHNVVFVKDREDNENRGVYFNGKSYVKLPRLSNQSRSSAYTLVVIFKPESIPNEPVEWPSFRVIGTTNYSPGIHFRKNKNVNFEGGAQKAWTKVTGRKISTGVYSHVAAVADVENNNTRIYINGEIKGSKNWDLDSDKEKNIVEGAARRFWSGNVVIGIGDPRENIKPEAFVGVIDEVRIYNRVLTDAEVEMIYKGPTK